MCRITGIWEAQRSGNLRETCAEMLKTLVRGGPDDAGIFVDEENNIAFGHRRLSIIDLSPTGHQPMVTPDGRHIICYNGEVYNYRDLRNDLMKLGATFRGSSDAEVVLNAFAIWGPKCVRRFIGMFAFAIWDSEDKALYLFRDRIGVKPLYYYCSDGLFAFASELKALHKGFSSQLKLDKKSLGEFFHYGYIAAPRTIYRHTYKLEPGHWLKIKTDQEIENHRYWSFTDAFSQEPVIGTEEEISDQLEELMIDAFKKRLIADVPVGIFLSGGIDSSLVTAILARHSGESIKTFTIGFKERDYDESHSAGKIAEYIGTEHTARTVTPEDAKETLPLWPEIYDEPFGDISGIPTAILSRMTRGQVKVSMSADGGDELFGGYRIYKNMKALERYLSQFPLTLTRIAGKFLSFACSEKVNILHRMFSGLIIPPYRDRLRKLYSVLGNWKGNASSAYSFAVSYWLPHEVDALVGAYTDLRSIPLSNRGELIEALMQWDITHYLPDDILTKVDRASMFTGLEGREPFLDHRIVEFAMRLSIGLKYRHNSQKYILKRLLQKYLPLEMFDRPKHGFAVPLYTWLHKDLMGMVDIYLNPDIIRAEGNLNPFVINKMVSLFKNGKGNVAVDRIWLLLVYMMWQEKYL